MANPGRTSNPHISGYRSRIWILEDLFFKNAATDWGTFAGGTLPVYMSNVAASEVNSIAMEILANTDLSRTSGARFYVGYGITPEEMVAAGRYRIVYQVP